MSGCTKLIQSPFICALSARSGAWAQVLLLVIMLLMPTACAHYPANPKLESIDKVLQIKDRGFVGSRHASKELLLVLSFSGGGTRAAAMSYGVLEALDRVGIPYAGEEAKTANFAGLGIFTNPNIAPKSRPPVNRSISSSGTIVSTVPASCKLCKSD